MVSKSRIIDLVTKYNEDVFRLINKDVFGVVEQPLGSVQGAVNRILAIEFEGMLKSIMPTIITISVNDPSWYKQVKNYWDSFGIRVPVGGKHLEIGFNFTFHEIAGSEKDRNIKALVKIAAESKEKIEIKDDLSLANYVIGHVSEFEKYKYGTPISPKDYLTWVFLLGHRKVAKNDVAANVGKSTNIEFVLIDPKEIEDQRRAQHSVSLKALQKYIEILPDRAKVKDILFIRGIDASTMDDLDCDARLKTFADSSPKEFLKLVDDSSSTIRATIEKYCMRGILKRLDNTAIIVDANDNAVVVGNTMDEAIAFFASETQDRVAKVKEFKTRFNQVK